MNPYRLDEVPLVSGPITLDDMDQAAVGTRARAGGIACHHIPVRFRKWLIGRTQITKLGRPGALSCLARLCEAA